MKQNRKERLEALLLAVLFLAQAILGILPARRVMADASVIERWDENTVMDYGYRFNVKYQPGITKVETYGCDNLDKIAFTNHGRSERNADTVRMTGNYKAESAGVRYYNVGRDGEGNIIDFKMSLVSVENPNPAMICRLQFLNTMRRKGREHLTEHMIFQIILPSRW